MGFEGIPGHEFVGTVVAGSSALNGRRVVAEINCVCRECDMCRAAMPTHCRRRTVVGILNRNGAFAELLSVPAANCHAVPDEIADQQAVFVEPLAAAVQVVKLHPVRHDTHVAVLGTGRLGLLVAQVLARHKCSLEVIGRNERSLAICTKLGLPAVPIEQVVPEAAHDLVVECTGAPAGLRLAMQLVRPRGTIVLKSTYADPSGIDLAPIVINEVRVVGNRCGPFPDAIALLREHKIAVDGMVSAVYPLERGPEAFAAAADARNIKVLLQPQPN
jgi:threonine dehydrogenase-like Zn-dependent dehydrogenase